MAKLILRGKAFQQVSARSMSELEIEEQILHRGELFFPDFYTRSLKSRVHTELRLGAEADLCLIDKRFRSWWVVEVELEHHSGKGHVVPQMEKLTTAFYDPDRVSKHLHKQDSLPDLDKQKLHQLIHRAYPRFLVISHGDKTPSWADKILGLGVKLAILTSFRDSTTGDAGYLLKGDWPTIPAKEDCGEIQNDKRTPEELWLIKEPVHLLSLANDEKDIELIIDGKLFNGNIVEMVDCACLRIHGEPDLNIRKTYRLSQTAEGRVIIN